MNYLDTVLDTGGDIVVDDKDEFVPRRNYNFSYRLLLLIEFHDFQKCIDSEQLAVYKNLCPTADDLTTDFFDKVEMDEIAEWTANLDIFYQAIEDFNVRYHEELISIRAFADNISALNGYLDHLCEPEEDQLLIVFT